MGEGEEPAGPASRRRKKAVLPSFIGAGVCRFTRNPDPPRCQRTNRVHVALFQPPVLTGQTSDFRLLPFARFALASLGCDKGVTLEQATDFLKGYLPADLAADTRFPRLLRIIFHRNARTRLFFRRQGRWFLRPSQLWRVHIPQVLDNMPLKGVTAGWTVMEVCELIADYKAFKLHILRQRLPLQGDCHRVHGREVYFYDDVRWHESNPAGTCVVVVPKCENQVEYSLAIAQHYVEQLEPKPNGDASAADVNDEMMNTAALQEDALTSEGEGDTDVSDEP